MSRFLIDALHSVSKAFPAAAANNNSDTIDLGSTPTSRPEGPEIAIKLPENSTLVATKDIYVKLQDSADDSTYADVPQLGTITVVGKSGDGMPDTDGEGYEVDADGNVWIFFPLPRQLNRYLQANIAVETGGGDLTSLNYEVALVV